MATAAILAAVAATLDRKRILPPLFLVIALIVHPVMALFGISFCLFLSLTRASTDKAAKDTALASTAASASRAIAFGWLPLGWVFDAPPPAWLHALAGPDYLFLTRWEWYEWLGVLAPLPILWWFGKIAVRGRLPAVAKLSRSLIYFAAFQLLAAMAMLSIPALARIRPLQPMRYLHLFYFLFVLLGGGLLGQKVLRGHAWRWLLLFVPLSAGMYFGQRESFLGTEHLEQPGGASRNSWVQAFRWIQKNTPEDALFALDPFYLQLRGEDYHGFRAVAERSAMADMLKDRVVAAQVPLLAPIWEEQTNAEKGWARFQKADFERLKTRYGVSWVVLVSAGTSKGMNCPYRNREVLVCRVD